MPLIVLLLVSLLLLSGCMAEPTIMECNLVADDCQCECKTSLDNPTTFRIIR